MYIGIYKYTYFRVCVCVSLCVCDMMHAQTYMYVHSYVVYLINPPHETNIRKMTCI